MTLTVRTAGVRRALMQDMAILGADCLTMRLWQQMGRTRPRPHTPTKQMWADGSGEYSSLDQHFWTNSHTYCVLQHICTPGGPSDTYEWCLHNHLPSELHIRHGKVCVCGYLSACRNECETPHTVEVNCIECVSPNFWLHHMIIGLGCQKASAHTLESSNNQK